MISREEKNQDVQEKFDKDERIRIRKEITKKTIKIVLIIVFLCTSFYLYVTKVSTHGIIVREERIKSSKIPSNFNSYKVIYFSDLYYNKDSKKDLDNLINKINERRPDLVLYSSNLLKGNINNKDREYLTKKLKSINSTSKYALSNNDTEKNILMQSGFTIINDKEVSIYNGIGNPISLTSGKKENDNYTIALLENPDDAESVNANLMLSGKSLNGKICVLPELLCLYKIDGAKTYYKSYYDVNKTPLYIAGGIGTNGINLRFNARPSIYFFRFTSL